MPVRMISEMQKQKYHTAILVSGSCLVVVSAELPSRMILEMKWAWKSPITDIRIPKTVHHEKLFLPLRLNISFILRPP